MSITFNGGLYAQVDDEGNLYMTYVYKGVLIVRRLLSGSDLWESILSEDWTGIGVVFREASMVVTPKGQLYVTVAAKETATFDPSVSDGQGVYLFHSRNPDSYNAKSTWSSQYIGERTTECHYPMVTSDESGSAHVTWHGYLDSEDFQVFYTSTNSIERVQTVSGEAPDLRVTGVQGNAIFPSIVAWGGVIIVAWKFGNPSPGIGPNADNKSLLYYALSTGNSSDEHGVVQFGSQYPLYFDADDSGYAVDEELSSSHDPALWSDKQDNTQFWLAIHGEQQGTISIRSADLTIPDDNVFGIDGAQFKISDTAKNNFAHSSANAAYSFTVWTAFSDALGEIDLYGCFGCTGVDPEHWSEIDSGIAQVSDRIEIFKSSTGETSFGGTLYAPVSEGASSYLMSGLRIPASEAQSLVGKNIVVESGFRLGRFKVKKYSAGDFELELIATPNNLAEGAVAEDIELNEYRTTMYDDIILYRYGEFVDFYVAEAMFGALQPTAVLSHDNTIHVIWLEMVVPAKEDAVVSDDGGNRTDYVRFRYRRGKIKQKPDSNLVKI